MNIQDFLTWLASAGGASAALAFILERIGAFQALSTNAKSWITLGGTVAISLAAFAILTYVPKDVLAQLAPAFQVVSAVVVSWLASQFAHTGDPKRISDAADIAASNTCVSSKADAQK